MGLLRATLRVGAIRQGPRVPAPAAPLRRGAGGPVRRPRSTGPFLAELLTSVDWSGYDIVGFASSCNQNVASLSLARMLKRAHPSLEVVLGGANWAGPLGVAMLTRFPFVDVAFLGEADRSLPMLVDAVGAGRDPSEVRHSRHRLQAERRDPRHRRCPVFGASIALPSPDFTDYFTCLDRHEGVRDRREVSLWLQMSRGCWWGEKQPCRFCGLNGPRREYRTKSSRRILEELRRTAALWPGLPINLADTVVAPALLDEVLRGLADDPLGVPLWFEVRPTLTRSQVRAIAAAKASIRVGAREPQRPDARADAQRIDCPRRPAAAQMVRGRRRPLDGASSTTFRARRTRTSSR